MFNIKSNDKLKYNKLNKLKFKIMENKFLNKIWYKEYWSYIKSGSWLLLTSRNKKIENRKDSTNQKTANDFFQNLCIADVYLLYLYFFKNKLKPLIVQNANNKTNIHTDIYFKKFILKKYNK